MPSTHDKMYKASLIIRGDSVHVNQLSFQIASSTGFIRGILRGVRYAKSLRVLFLHRRSPSWTTLVLYSRAVFIFNEPTILVLSSQCDVLYLWRKGLSSGTLFLVLILCCTENEEQVS